MPDLSFRIEGVSPERNAAAPLLVFQVRISENRHGAILPTPIHSVALRCQIQIEPGRRQYSLGERERLRDLFGTSDRWSQTVRPMLWTHACAVVHPFIGATIADLHVACSYDFSLAATRYFAALDDGDIPLRFLFGGAIFYDADGLPRVEQVSWEKEATFSLPAFVWHELMAIYYPGCKWLAVPNDVYAALNDYRRRMSLGSFDEAIEKLLSQIEEPAVR